MKIKLSTVKPCKVPTLTGWLALGAIFLAAFVIMLSNIEPFLSVSASVDAKVMIAEGWLPDYALYEAFQLFKERHYTLLITTGAPLEIGSFLSDYSTYAHVAAAAFKKMGVDSGALVAVAAADVKADRTYASAREVKKWIERSGRSIGAIDLVSLGPHARRSRMLFQKALGPAIRVGVLSYADRTYDARHWWKSSNGFRKVSDELIAYCYARCIFMFKK